LKQLNVEFVAIARELQGLQSVGVYHAGSQPTGTEPVPDDFPVQLQPAPAPQPFAPPAPVTGLVLSHFRRPSDAKPKQCLMGVNLDYKKRVMLAVRAKRPLEMFDAAQSRWPGILGETLELNLLPGGGALLRLTE
jgi:hypothetical protein